MVVDMLRQLTLNEWKVLKEVATEGLTGKETNLVASLISEKTGLNGADSATHVLARALSVLHRTARVQDMESKHVLSALAEVMAGLKEKGITEKSRLERK
jgi:hypothetical protein